MSVQRFVQYAAAFEEAYVSRDFSRLEEFFTEDARYRIEGPDGPRMEHVGREAVLEYMAWITEHFDQRFERRKIVRTEGPLVDGAAVEIHGAAVYSLTPREHCYLSMSEVAHFRGDRIERLVDTLTPGGQRDIEAMVERHPEIFDPRVLEAPA